MQSKTARLGRMARRTMLVCFCLTLGWAIWLIVAGGFDATILGIRVRSNNPRRVLVASACALVGYLVAGGTVRVSPFLNALARWTHDVRAPAWLGSRSDRRRRGGPHHGPRHQDRRWRRRIWIRQSGRSVARGRSESAAAMGRPGPVAQQPVDVHAARLPSLTR